MNIPYRDSVCSYVDSAESLKIVVDNEYAEHGDDSTKPNTDVEIQTCDNTIQYLNKVLCWHSLEQDILYNEEEDVFGRSERLGSLRQSIFGHDRDEFISKEYAAFISGSTHSTEDIHISCHNSGRHSEQHPDPENSCTNTVRVCKLVNQLQVLDKKCDKNAHRSKRKRSSPEKSSLNLEKKKCLNNHIDSMNSSEENTDRKYTKPLDELNMPNFTEQSIYLGFLQSLGVNPSTLSDMPDDVMADLKTKIKNEFEHFYQTYQEKHALTQSESKLKVGDRYDKKCDMEGYQYNSLVNGCSSFVSLYHEDCHSHPETESKHIVKSENNFTRQTKSVDPEILSLDEIKENEMDTSNDKESESLMDIVKQEKSVRSFDDDFYLSVESSDDSDDSYCYDRLRRDAKFREEFIKERELVTGISFLERNSCTQLEDSDVKSSHELLSPSKSNHENHTDVGDLYNNFLRGLNIEASSGNICSNKPEFTPKHSSPQMKLCKKVDLLKCGQVYQKSKTPVCENKDAEFVMKVSKNSISDERFVDLARHPVNSQRSLTFSQPKHKKVLQKNVSDNVSTKTSNLCHSDVECTETTGDLSPRKLSSDSRLVHSKPNIENSTEKQDTNLCETTISTDDTVLSEFSIQTNSSFLGIFEGGVGNSPEKTNAFQNGVHKESNGHKAKRTENAENVDHGKRLENSSHTFCTQTNSTNNLACSPKRSNSGSVRHSKMTLSSTVHVVDNREKENCKHLPDSQVNCDKHKLKEKKHPSTCSKKHTDLNAKSHKHKIKKCENRELQKISNMHKEHCEKELLAPVKCQSDSSVPCSKNMLENRNIDTSDAGQHGKIKVEPDTSHSTNYNTTVNNYNDHDKKDVSVKSHEVFSKKYPTVQNDSLTNHSENNIYRQRKGDKHRTKMSKPIRYSGSFYENNPRHERLYYRHTRSVSCEYSSDSDCEKTPRYREHSGENSKNCRYRRYSNEHSENPSNRCVSTRMHYYQRGDSKWCRGPSDEDNACEKAKRMYYSAEISNKSEYSYVFRDENHARDRQHHYREKGVVSDSNWCSSDNSDSSGDRLYRRQTSRTQVGCVRRNITKHAGRDCDASNNNNYGHNSKNVLSAVKKGRVAGCIYISDDPLEDEEDTSLSSNRLDDSWDATNYRVDSSVILKNSFSAPSLIPMIDMSSDRCRQKTKEAKLKGMNNEFHADECQGRFTGKKSLIGQAPVAIVSKSKQASETSLGRTNKPHKASNTSLNQSVNSGGPEVIVASVTPIENCESRLLPNSTLHKKKRNRRKNNSKKSKVQTKHSNIDNSRGTTADQKSQVTTLVKSDVGQNCLNLDDKNHQVTGLDLNKKQADNNGKLISTGSVNVMEVLPTATKPIEKSSVFHEKSTVLRNAISDNKTSSRTKRKGRDDDISEPTKKRPNNCIKSKPIDFESRSTFNENSCNRIDSVGDIEAGTKDSPLDKANKTISQPSSTGEQSSSSRAVNYESADLNISDQLNTESLCNVSTNAINETRDKQVNRLDEASDKATNSLQTAGKKNIRAVILGTEYVQYLQQFMESNSQNLNFPNLSTHIISSNVSLMSDLSRKMHMLQTLQPDVVLLIAGENDIDSMQGTEQKFKSNLKRLIKEIKLISTFIIICDILPKQTPLHPAFNIRRVSTNQMFRHFFYTYPFVAIWNHCRKPFTLGKTLNLGKLYESVKHALNLFLNCEVHYNLLQVLKLVSAKQITVQRKRKKAIKRGDPLAIIEQLRGAFKSGVVPGFKSVKGVSEKHHPVIETSIISHAPRATDLVLEKDQVVNRSTQDSIQEAFFKAEIQELTQIGKSYCVRKSARLSDKDENRVMCTKDNHLTDPNVMLPDNLNAHISPVKQKAEDYNHGAFVGQNQNPLSYDKRSHSALDENLRPSESVNTSLCRNNLNDIPATDLISRHKIVVIGHALAYNLGLYTAMSSAKKESFTPPRCDVEILGKQDNKLNMKDLMSAIHESLSQIRSSMYILMIGENDINCNRSSVNAVVSGIRDFISKLQTISSCFVVLCQILPKDCYRRKSCKECEKLRCQINDLLVEAFKDCRDIKLWNHEVVLGTSFKVIGMQNINKIYESIKQAMQQNAPGKWLNADKLEELHAKETNHVDKESMKPALPTEPKSGRNQGKTISIAEPEHGLGSKVDKTVAQLQTGTNAKTAISSSQGSLVKESRGSGKLPYKGDAGAVGTVEDLIVHRKGMKTAKTLCCVEDEIARTTLSRTHSVPVCPIKNKETKRIVKSLSGEVEGKVEGDKVSKLTCSVKTAVGKVSETRSLNKSECLGGNRKPTAVGIGAVNQEAFCTLSDRGCNSLSKGGMDNYNILHEKALHFKAIIISTCHTIVNQLKDGIENTIEKRMTVNFGIKDLNVEFSSPDNCPESLNQLASSSVAKLFPYCPDIALIISGENDLDNVSFSLEKHIKNVKNLVKNVQDFGVKYIVLCEILPKQCLQFINIDEYNKRKQLVNKTLKKEFEGKDFVICFESNLSLSKNRKNEIFELYKNIRNILRIVFKRLQLTNSSTVKSFTASNKYDQVTKIISSEDANCSISTLSDTCKNSSSSVSSIKKQEALPSVHVNEQESKPVFVSSKNKNRERENSEIVNSVDSLNAGIETLPVYSSQKQFIHSKTNESSLIKKNNENSESTKSSFQNTLRERTEVVDSRITPVSSTEKKCSGSEELQLHEAKSVTSFKTQENISAFKSLDPHLNCGKHDDVTGNSTISVNDESMNSNSKSVKKQNPSIVLSNNSGKNVSNVHIQRPLPSLADAELATDYNVIIVAPSLSQFFIDDVTKERDTSFEKNFGIKCFNVNFLRPEYSPKCLKEFVNSGVTCFIKKPVDIVMLMLGEGDVDRDTYCLDSYLDNVHQLNSKLRDKLNAQTIVWCEMLSKRKLYSTDREQFETRRSDLNEQMIKEFQHRHSVMYFTHKKEVKELYYSLSNKSSIIKLYNSVRGALLQVKERLPKSNTPRQRVTEQCKAKNESTDEHKLDNDCKKNSTSSADKKCLLEDQSSKAENMLSSCKKNTELTSFKKENKLLPQKTPVDAIHSNQLSSVLPKKTFMAAVIGCFCVENFKEKLLRVSDPKIEKNFGLSDLEAEIVSQSKCPKTLLNLVPLISSLLKTKPDILFVNLGENDIDSKIFRPDLILDSIDKLLQYAKNTVGVKSFVFCEIPSKTDLVHINRIEYRRRQLEINCELQKKFSNEQVDMFWKHTEKSVSSVNENEKLFSLYFSVKSALKESAKRLEKQNTPLLKEKCSYNFLAQGNSKTTAEKNICEGNTVEKHNETTQTPKSEKKTLLGDKHHAKQITTVFEKGTKQDREEKYREEKSDGCNTSVLQESGCGKRTHSSGNSIKNLNADTCIEQVNEINRIDTKSLKKCQKLTQSVELKSREVITYSESRKIRQVSIVGQSLIQTLKILFKKTPDEKFKENFGLKNIKVELIDGPKSPNNLKDFCFEEIKILQNSPDIVVLFLPENEVDSKEFSKDSFIECVQRIIFRLQNELNIAYIILCQITPRKNPSKISRSEYIKNINDLNVSLKLELEESKYIRFWNNTFILKTVYSSSLDDLCVLYNGIKQIIFQADEMLEKLFSKTTSQQLLTTSDTGAKDKISRKGFVPPSRLSPQTTKAVIIGRNSAQSLKEFLAGKSQPKVSKNFNIKGLEVEIFGQLHCPSTLEDLLTAPLDRFLHNSPEIMMFMIGENDVDSASYNLKRFLGNIRRFIFRLQNKVNIPSIILCEVMQKRRPVVIPFSEFENRKNIVNEKLKKEFDKSRSVMFWEHKGISRDSTFSNDRSNIGQLYESVKEALAIARMNPLISI